MVRLLLLIALIAAGCGFDESGVAIETPPLRLRPPGTVPADSTELLYDTDGLSLVVMFNREFGPGEVSYLQIIPHPAVMGATLNPSDVGRQLRLESVVLDTVYPAYRLVLDGPSMPQPEILSYYSGPQSVTDGGIQGHVFIARGGTKPGDALVYALVPPGLEDDFPLTGAEETLLGRPILGVTKTLLVQTEEGGWYRLGGLQNYRRYLVLAILDTTGDGTYNLEEDWWGYWRDEVDAPLEVIAGVPFGGAVEPPLPEIRTDIDFWLQEPGALNPSLDPEL